MTPDASIVIPSLNRRSMLASALASCAAAAPARSVEVIVVDDGSTDRTSEWLRDTHPAVIVLTNETNRGRNVSRNRGLDRATGRYVKFLDSDDRLVGSALQAELDLAEQKSADVVASGYQNAVLSGSEARPGVAYRAPVLTPKIDRLLEGQSVPTSAALYRTELARRVRWDESLSKLDDWDFFIRACLGAGTVVTWQGISYQWCEHAEQGIRRSTMQQNALEHHAILRGLWQQLESTNELTPPRRKRLAQYLYKELRVLSLHAPAEFERGVEWILELDPGFVPCDEEPKQWMRWMCRILGLRRGVLVHRSAKRLLARSPHG